MGADPGHVIRLLWPSEILQSSYRRWAILPHLVLAIPTGLGPFIDAGSYSSPVFAAIFALLSPKVWGVMFLLVAALCFHVIFTASWHAYRTANALHMTLCAAWLASLSWGRLVDGYPVSLPAFGLWGGMLACGLVLAVIPTPVLRTRERRYWDRSRPRPATAAAVAAPILAGTEPVVEGVQGLGLQWSSIIVAIISAGAGFGGTALMYRGKVTDTANWLVQQLREDAEAARAAANEATEEAHMARTESTRAWEKVQECESRHAEVTDYLARLVIHLDAVGVPLPDVDPPEHLDG